jgi:hypothetical protein
VGEDEEEVEENEDEDGEVADGDRGRRKGSSGDSPGTSTRGVSTRVETKRRSKTPDVVAPEAEEEEDDEQDLSAEMDAIDRENDGEPRDEDGWSVAELTALGNAVKSSASLDASVVYAAASKASGLSRPQDDVSRYLHSVSAVIREYCPRTPSAASSDAGIRINDMLSFIAAEVWRLVSDVVRPAGEMAKQIRREARLRAALDKAKRKQKRELEEVRAKLEAEMELRRRAQLEAAYHQLRVGECRRALSREQAKRWRTEAETDLFKRRDQDAKERTERVRLLFGQLRGEQVPGAAAEPAADDDADAMDVVPAENGVLPGVDADADTDAAAVDSGTSADLEGCGPGAEREAVRLRTLIATYEAEAEAGQRACEVERARANLLAESKAKVEMDMYVQRAGLLHQYGNVRASVAAAGLLNGGKVDGARGKPAAAASAAQAKPAASPPPLAQQEAPPAAALARRKRKPMRSPPA